MNPTNNVIIQSLKFSIEEKIPEIIKAYDGSNIVSITAAKAGHNNPIFIIETTNKQSVVLRVLNNTIKGKIQKESIIYKLLDENNIPIAKILKMDDDKNIIPYDYLLQEQILGDSLANQKNKLPASQLTEIYKELGIYLARIHSITFDQFGDLQLSDGKIEIRAPKILGDNKGPFKEWKTMFIEIIKSRLENLNGTEFEDLNTKVLNYFEKNINLVDYNITPRLLHMDLHGSNIFVHNGHISGILDVEEALIGHNEYDLMRTEIGNFDENSKDLKDIFFKEYTHYIPLDKGYEDRRTFYYLSRTLVQARCLTVFGEKYSNRLKDDIELTRNEILTIIS